MMADWIRYFESEIPPTNLEETRKTLYGFTASHIQNARNVVFITSGGTTVPLETNTVRFIDNFSSGARGAASAEYFLSQGYAVVFVYRQKSALPFQRYFIAQNPLEFLNVNDNIDNPLPKSIMVDESKAPGLKEILLQYREVKRNGTLLQIEFTTLSSYLFLLRMSAETLSAFGHRVMFYLAAAVSDFYIPRENLSTHKIQSSQGPLVLNLQQTPKLLQPLVKDWSPQAFVVSFKLETDVNIISKKARESLNNNSHQVVISNILQTRRKTVVIVTASEENAIWMSDSELEQGKDIEEKIVADLAKKHSEFIRSNSLPGYNASNELSLEKSFPIAVTSGQVIYLSEGTTYQLQGRVAENPTSTMLLSPSQTQQFAMTSSYGVRKPEDSSASRPLQTEGGELDTLSTTATNLASKFKYAYDNTALSEDMKAFIEMFKNKRMTLGYTQEDVGVELSRISGPTYSQSFISRFESKQLAAKASEKMRPILQAWLDAKDVDQTTGLRLCKKRRRRTSFTSDALAVLVENYQKNPKPNTNEIAEIAAQLNIEPVTVKVWFCNRKQGERRRSQGKMKTSETLKSELQARSTSKEQERPNGEQIASYSLERLQPLIAEQEAAPPVTVLDTDTTHVVQFQSGVPVARNDDSNSSLTQNSSPPYSSSTTVIDADQVQFQPGTTPDTTDTSLTQGTSYSTPVAVMETEVPTSV
ncbi:uncharacterized protein LOC114534012 [Dendronephthya gigantea]|uniref:uncharacterized protein LOC114534012 n=1 Tax=Dendronephthya gigantea TaxID=151771 RepID=UPI00106ABD8F|nr:uncharacterized protein LOC114534012 [Dendronephthya gigantea]